MSIGRSEPSGSSVLVTVLYMPPVVQAEPDLRTASSNSRSDRLRSADCQPVRRPFFLTSALH